MEFELCNVIDFAKEFWGFTQKEIALEYLKWSESKLARHPYNGKIKRQYFESKSSGSLYVKDIDSLYWGLFDLANKNSAASKFGNAESELIDELKAYISRTGHKEAFEDIWDKEDYKPFIMEVLRNARMWSAKTKVGNNNEDEAVQLCNTQVSEEMRDAFLKIAQFYKIMDIFSVDTSYVSERDLGEIHRFCSTIESKLNATKESHGNLHLYHKINEITAMIRFQFHILDGKINPMTNRSKKPKHPEEGFIVNVRNYDVYSSKGKMPKQKLPWEVESKIRENEKILGSLSNKKRAKAEKAADGWKWDNFCKTIKALYIDIREHKHE